MRQLLPVFLPSAVLARACCLLAASALIGCASKNPLMEEAAVATAPAAKPAAPVTAAASSAPAPTASASQSGVQTSKERRFFGIFSPYRVDVQQGNFISKEMLSQLKIGMTPDQVRFVLGTPLLNDIFHANRWDYAFRLEKGNGQVVSSRIAVHFQDNRVAKIDAGDLPSEQDYLSLIAGTAATPKAATSAAK